MTDYVLTLRADQDAAGNDPPMTLRQVGDPTPIAIHQSGFDTAPFIRDGETVDPASCLTAEGLLNRAQTEFVGKSLWERLTPGDIGTQLRLQAANSRIYLDLQSHALAAYPWELLRDSDWLLFTESRICIGQPHPSLGGRQGNPPATDHPLRVLVVVGNDPADDMIQAEDELVAIEAAAQSKNDEVLLRALIRPKPQDIKEALLKFRPHVFHFIGHGVRPAVNAEPEIYVYCALTGQNDPWEAGRIRSVFRLMPPRLVVLNACLTGDAPTASTSLVKAFLDAGCMAVVAMMGEIRGDASHAFSKYFYADLFAGNPVDAAVANARRDVRDLEMGQGMQANVPALRSNWPLPRLTVCGDIETVITMTMSGNMGVRRWLIDDFVVRWEERWRVWQLLEGTHSRLALVSGKKQAGKTELLNTVAATWARHGEKVILVDLGGKKTGDGWRDVLEKIANAADKEGLPPNRLRAIPQKDGKSGAVIQEFQDELARCVGIGNRLLLVLDGLSDWEENIVRGTLLPELCEPYLLPTGAAARVLGADRNEHTGGDVRMLLAMREDWSDVWQALPNDWHTIEVGEFLGEWDRALTHFMAHCISLLPEAKRADFCELVEPYRRIGAKTGTGQTLQLIRGTADMLRGA